MFVTVFYGILNLATGEIEYVNGGHNPPYILTDNNVKKVEMTGGTILGCMDDFVYSSKKVRLNPGDLIFLFTDGVTEAFNAQEEMYGDERLVAFLQDHHALPVDEIVKESNRAVFQFSAGIPQSDDITLLSIRYQEPH